MEGLTKPQLCERIAEINRHLLYSNVPGSLYIEGAMKISGEDYLYQVRGKKIYFYLKPNIEDDLFWKYLSILNKSQLIQIVEQADIDDCDAECDDNCPCRERPL